MLSRLKISTCETKSCIYVYINLNLITENFADVAMLETFNLKLMSTIYFLVSVASY